MEEKDRGHKRNGSRHSPTLKKENKTPISINTQSVPRSKHSPSRL